MFGTEEDSRMRTKPSPDAFKWSSEVDVNQVDWEPTKAYKITIMCYIKYKKYFHCLVGQDFQAGADVNELDPRTIQLSKIK